MWKAGTLLASCAMLALGLSLPAKATADDDWDDYYEDLEDAREDYYDDLDDYHRVGYGYGYAPAYGHYGSSYGYGHCEPYGSYYSPGYTTYYRPGYYSSSYYRPRYSSSFYGRRYYGRPGVGVWFGGW